MPGACPIGRAGAALVLSAIVFGIAAGIAFLSVPAARGQDEAPEMPDVPTLERQLEEMFETAVAMSDDEPMHVFQTWSTVIMSAVVLERRRSMAQGRDPSSAVDSLAVTDEILRRWQRRRPESAGPDLMRTFRIQDPTAKRDAVLAVADRYPDDALALSQAVQVLRQTAEPERAAERAEAFVARNPERGIGYRMLVRTARDNETRLAAILQRWAAAVPGDPDLVTRWLASPIAGQEPDLTHRILAEFFDRSPTDRAGLEVCLRILRRADSAFADRARRCVARLASDPELPENVTERATTALAETTASEGDWGSFLDTLDSLDREGRIRALVNVARRLDAPTRCTEIVDLLTAAAEGAAGDGIDHRSLASAMRECSERPDARRLFLDLLRRAPPDRVASVLTSWVTKVNGAWRGELPPGTAGVLEERIRDRGDGNEWSGLFRALDIVYQIEAPEARRFELLMRWYRSAPTQLGGDQAVDLARGLVARDRPDEAIAVLEGQLESRLDVEAAESLWSLYLQTEGETRATAFARELIDGDRERERSIGHLLAARSALVREDLPAAEDHYLRALDGERFRREVAVELLSVLGSREGEDRIESLAERICRDSLADGSTTPEACAADLLTRSGRSDVALGFLAGGVEELPEDLARLRKIASTARAAGRPELAEAARRRILELDPRSEGSWTGLGVFLERQGRADEVEELLERSREIFPSPPTALYRAAGRALTSAGRPGRAIDLLLEARAGLAEDGGKWSRGWIDHELREAYEALGESLPATRAHDRPAPLPAFETSATEISEGSETGSGEELRRRADSLQTGTEGRYDPDAALELYRRATVKGDPLAAFRLALLRRLAPERTGEVDIGPEGLYRRSADAVTAAARDGDTYAAYLLGTAALVGLGGAADYGTARRWFEAAAGGDEPWAWHNLAWMAETGRGREPDPTAAVNAYRRASRAGNVVSMVDLARLTLTRQASGVICEEGLEWLTRSARAGNAKAAAFLGKLLFYGRGECVAADPEAALPWLEAGVATRQPGADLDLGLALVASAQDTKDRRRGLALLRQAAEEPSTLAMEILAFLHASGIGTPRDPAEAERLLAEAARHGSDGLARLRAEARISDRMRDLVDRGSALLEQHAEEGDAWTAALLARFHQVGLVPEADPRRAVELARRAAAAGEARAMRVLMHAYGMGEGVDEDEAESLRWMRRGAEAGDSFCMMFLGHDLLEGEKTARNLEAGLAWLRRAAESGNWWATSDLARFFDEGAHGVPRDPEKAAAWQRRRAELGDPEARGWLHYHGLR